MNTCEHDGYKMHLGGFFVVLQSTVSCLWQLGGQEIKKSS